MIKNMDFPLQPRNRASLAPATVNKLISPASSSGSEKAVPARARGGFTPRCGSKTKTSHRGRIGIYAKPQFTPAQQLEIIRCLEMGYFKVGTGLNQFHDKLTGDPSSKPNLFPSFASVDPIASSTRNYENGTDSMESLASGGEVDIMPVSVNGTDITTIEAPVQAPVHRLMMEDEDASSPDLSNNTLERFLLLRENFYQSLEELAKNKSATKFSERLPQDKLESFFQSLERVQKILQNFLKGTASKNMKLFLPFPEGKDSASSSSLVIRCDVKYQSDVVNAFYKLSEFMRRLDTFMKQESFDFKFDANMDNFKDLVSQLENSIRTQEEYSQDLKNIDAKFKILQLEDKMRNWS